MSIHDKINARCHEDPRELHRIHPERECRRQRELYITSAVWDALYLGPHRERDRRCWARAKADIHKFVEGVRLLVRDGRPARPYDGAALVRLARPGQPPGMWEIRGFDRTPALRFLGRFAWKDAFVILGWRYRRDLPTQAEWDTAIIECIAEWDRLSTSPPLTEGVFPNDYASYTDVVS